MPALLTVIALILALLLPADRAGAAVYTYKDEHGRTVFVDDAYRVPGKYRGNTQVIQERRDQAAPVAAEADQGEQAEPAAAAGSQDETAEPPARAVFDRETELRARQQVELLDRERARQSPVMVRGNRVLVPVEVGVGTRTAHLMLLLDTGATSTVLHRSSVKDLSFASGEQINARIAGGRTLKSEKVVTRFIDIGPYELKDFPVMLVTPQGSHLPFDGMLGMDFLKNHPYEIDFANEVIRWRAAP